MSTLSSVPAEAGRPDAAGAVLDVAVPVHNQEAGLEPCVRRLLAHPRANFPNPFRISIADNASRVPLEPVTPGCRLA